MTFTRGGMAMVREIRRSFLLVTPLKMDLGWGFDRWRQNRDLYRQRKQCEHKHEVGRRMRDAGVSIKQGCIPCRGWEQKTE